MSNVFEEQSEFLTEDPRSRRPENSGVGYQVTPDFMLKRHEILLPPDTLRGKRVLDLGSCLAASGAWCLAHGAAFYQGVEIHNEFAEKSRACLDKYYAGDRWSIAEASIETYLSSNPERFDVLLAFGVMYGAADARGFLSLLSGAADFIVIESMQSQTAFHSRLLSVETRAMLARDPQIVEFLDNDSYIAVGRRAMVAPGGKTMFFHGVNPSMGAIKYMMTSLGFECDDSPNKQLRQAIPQHYSPISRFGLHFSRNPNVELKKYGLENAVADSSNILDVIEWNQK